MRETKAYILNTEAENKLGLGYKMIVRNKPSDVDDVYSGRILSAITSLSYNSVYVVGCGLGDILVNLKKLKRNTAVAGCEVSDLFLSYGNARFNINKHGVDFQVKEPPYHSLPYADLMVSLNYLGDNHEGRETFENMLNNSKNVILFDQYSIRQYMTQQFVDKCSSIEEEDYTLYTPIKKTKEFGLNKLVDFSQTDFQASGVLDPRLDLFNYIRCSG